MDLSFSGIDFRTWFIICFMLDLLQKPSNFFHAVIRSLASFNQTDVDNWNP